MWAMTNMILNKRKLDHYPIVPFHEHHTQRLRLHFPHCRQTLWAPFEGCVLCRD